jgi:hypothetical protein
MEQIKVEAVDVDVKVVVVESVNVDALVQLEAIVELERKVDKDTVVFAVAELLACTEPVVEKELLFWPD